MSTDDQARLDRRLLMLPATPKDGATTRDILWRAGIETELCNGARVLESEVQRGAAAVMLGEESIGQATRILALTIAQQPAVGGEVAVDAHNTECERDTASAPVQDDVACHAAREAAGPREGTPPGPQAPPRGPSSQPPWSPN